MKNRLKQLRTNKKLSQKAFATAFNDYLKEIKSNSKLITNTTVSRWENNQIEIPNEYLKVIANYFDVTVQYVQGLTFDKTDILKALNDTYLTNIEDNGVDNKDLINLNNIVEDPFSLSVSFALFSSLRNYMSYHSVKPTFSNHELKKFDDDVKQFWNRNFNFVFESDGIKGFINWGGKEEDLLNTLSKVIRGKYLKDSSTIISQLFDQTTKLELTDFINKKDELLRFGSHEEINEKIDELVASLQDFQSAIQPLPENPVKQLENINEYNDLPF